MRRFAPLRDLGDSLEEHQGHLGTDNRGGVQELFLLRWQPVDARRQDGLHGDRHLHGREGAHHAIGPRLAHQGAGLHQRPHAFLQEEGIALGALDQKLVEGGQAGVIPHEGLEEGIGIRRG